MIGAPSGTGEALEVCNVTTIAAKSLDPVKRDSKGRSQFRVRSSIILVYMTETASGGLVVENPGSGHIREECRRVGIFRANPNNTTLKSNSSSLLLKAQRSRL